MSSPKPPHDSAAGHTARHSEVFSGNRAPLLARAPLSRRGFLRGAGALAALPLLEAMIPSFARAQGEPVAPRSRFFAFYVPNGIHMAGYTPATLGTQWEATPILSSLDPLRAKVSILSGLKNDPARPDGPGDHAAGTGSFLTAAHCFKTEEVGIRNGISIDQVIANQVGGGYRFPSLVLGAEGGGNGGGCDSGYSCAYSRNISWVNENQPAAKEVRPRTLFNRLFGVAGAQVDPAALARQRRYTQSVLDKVRDDARRLEARLGATDRRKLDQYFTGVREVERQIELAEAQQCNAGQAPEDANDVRDTIRQMLDLSVLAFQCDLTPAITFMLGNAGSNRPYNFLNVPEGHHQLSHHQNDPAVLAKLQTIGTWEVSQLAYLLAQLDAVSDGPEGGATLLDNAAVFFSSEIEDGNAHRHSNLPVILAGGAAGQLTPGHHLRRDRANMADLLARLGTLCGAPLAAFGDDGVAPLDLSPA